MKTFSPLFVLTLALGACSADPEEGPNYEDTGTASSDTGTGPDVEFYPGSEPYSEGTERLSIGIFYEGAASEQIEVDDTTTHYYIYSDEFTNQVTYETYPDTEDRLEGYLSDVIVHAGGDWWGGGVHWDTATDLSAWDTLHLSLKSADSGFSVTDVAMQSSGGTEGKLTLSNYGFATDGEWHSLQIPLADFESTGLNLSAVTAPFVLVAAGGSSGEELRIDEVYFSKAAAE